MIDPDWTGNIVQADHVNAIWEMAGGEGLLAVGGKPVVPALKRLYDKIREQRNVYHLPVSIFKKGTNGLP